VKRTIRLTAIHNRTQPPVPVQVSHVDGAILTVEPGETLEGRWLVVYDTDEHPELNNIADVNQWWFTDSPTEFGWGAVTFSSGGPAARMSLGDWIAVYDDDD
jgi:hypothetical protein